MSKARKEHSRIVSEELFLKDITRMSVRLTRVGRESAADALSEAISLVYAQQEEMQIKIPPKLQVICSLIKTLLNDVRTNFISFEDYQNKIDYLFNTLKEKYRERGKTKAEELAEMFATDTYGDGEAPVKQGNYYYHWSIDNNEEEEESNSILDETSDENSMQFIQLGAVCNIETKKHVEAYLELTRIVDAIIDKGIDVYVKKMGIDVSKISYIRWLAKNAFYYSYGHFMNKYYSGSMNIVSVIETLGNYIILNYGYCSMLSVQVPTLGTAEEILINMLFKRSRNKLYMNIWGVIRMRFKKYLINISKKASNDFLLLDYYNRG